jgi:hypothetical protein
MSSARGTREADESRSTLRPDGWEDTDTNRLSPTSILRYAGFFNAFLGLLPDLLSCSEQTHSEHPTIVSLAASIIR